MKMRNGFVSNSSSSSFVVLVCEMAEEQKKEFHQMIDQIDFEEICYDYGEPSFSVSGKVYGGECDYGAQEEVTNVLKKMGCEKLMECLY